jgi:membrane-bound lytic murein transglycosylase B
MMKRFATFAAILALSATTIAAQAASRSDPGQDQRENAITAQLNQQQLQGGYGPETYEGIMRSQSPNQGMMQEQIAQPPSDSGDLSIIE